MPIKDSAAAADAAFERVKNQEFPADIFTAPELNWGLLGCGVIAHQMAHSLALAGRKIYAVANRTLAKAEAFAEKFGVSQVYASFDELIADPKVDAIYITTPHNTHINYLRQALTAGKHVLCEKSITLNDAELKEAIELARANDCVLMDATTILHMPLYKALLARKAAGDFGKLSLAQINFGSFKDYGDYSNRFYNPKLAGGALLDIGVYAFSILNLFFDEPAREMKDFFALAKTGVDETWAISCKNELDQFATLTMSLHAKLPKRAVFSFEKVYIEVDNYPRADRAKIVWTEDGRSEEVVAGEEGYALCYELADLEAAVAGAFDWEAQLRGSLATMEQMSSLRREAGVVYPEEAM